jgi:hypothetical protein
MLLRRGTTWAALPKDDSIPVQVVAEGIEPGTLNLERVALASLNGYERLLTVGRQGLRG